MHIFMGVCTFVRACIHECVWCACVCSCMHVSMNVWCACVRSCMHVSMDVCGVRVYIHACMYPWMCVVCVCTFMHACIHECVWCACVRACMHVSMDVCMFYKSRQVTCGTEMFQTLMTSLWMMRDDRSARARKRSTLFTVTSKWVLHIIHSYK